VPTEHAAVAPVAEPFVAGAEKDTSLTTKGSEVQLRFGLRGTGRRSQSTTLSVVGRVQFAPPGRFLPGTGQRGASSRAIQNLEQSTKLKLRQWRKKQQRTARNKHQPG